MSWIRKLVLSTQKSCVVRNSEQTKYDRDEVVYEMKLFSRMSLDVENK